MKNRNLVWIMMLTEFSSIVLLDSLRRLIRKLFRHLPYDILYIIWEEEFKESERRGEVIGVEE